MCVRLRRHAAAGCVVLLICTGLARAQSNPAPLTLPVSQGWGTAAFSSMPAGFAAWNGINGGVTNTQALAEASTPTGDAPMMTTTPASNGTGGCYGYLAAAGNARFAILQSSNSTNGASQLAMALNTLGQGNITLDFDYIPAVVNARTIGIVVQYRVGTSGGWTTLVGAGNPYTQSSSPPASTHVSLSLPAAADNQANVQIRWATWRGTESGSSSGTAIDNISVTGSPTSGSAPTVYAGPDRTLPMVNGALPVVMTDATADDADGLAGVTYAWTPASGTHITGWSNRTGSVVDVTSPSDAQVTLSAPGIYTFTLTATDPEAHSTSDDVVVTITPPVQSGPYDPPPGYYDPARPRGVWLTGATLKTALNGIISGHVVRSYDSAKQSLQFLDQDPGNSNNIILIYTGVSVPKAWDGGTTWNREHQWPDSLNGSGAADSDLFELRPCNPTVNSDRGNKAYGIGSAATFWDPDHGNPADRGSCSRAMFYMATRYTDLTLINGGSLDPGEMGDLTRMLEWHYAQPVTTFERRRNHLIYSQAENPTYYQGNRNPFIDHPELVWSIFGTGANTSTLFFGVSPPPGGASSTGVNFEVIVNAPPPSAPVTLSKFGTTPTTFDITTSGNSTCDPAGRGHAFIAGSQTRVLTVGLASTATVGSQAGTVVIDNTDITSGAPGQGSADGNDTVNVTAAILAHADASFTSPTDTNALTIDFGTYVAGNGNQVIDGAIHNLESVPGFSAELKINLPGATGDSTKLFPTMVYTGTVPAGTSRPFTATLDTTTAGAFSATYTFTVTDESLPGAAAGTPLVLTLTGQVVTPGPFAPADFNQDGDVDSDDFDHLKQCMTRAEVAVTNPACLDADLDADADSDLNDFALYQRCYSGAARPAVATCAE